MSVNCICLFEISIKADRRIGAIAHPSRLAIVIKHILFVAVSSGPKIVMYGLIAACNNVLPKPEINEACRNNKKLLWIPDGTYKYRPIANNTNEMMILCL